MDPNQQQQYVPDNEAEKSAQPVQEPVVQADNVDDTPTVAPYSPSPQPFSAPEQVSPSPEAPVVPTQTVPENQPEQVQQENQQTEPPVATPPTDPQSESTDNPGKALGMISIVLAVLGLGIIGVIFGVLSRNKSKKVGASTTLGTIGIVLSIVLTVLWAFVFALIAPNVYKNLQATTANATSQAATSDKAATQKIAKLTTEANMVASKAEVYNQKTGDYPKELSDFSKQPESAIPSGIFVNTTFMTSTNVTYIYCDTGSAQVAFYGKTKNDIHVTALGKASTTKLCVPVK
mgnify:FL=1